MKVIHSFTVKHEDKEVKFDIVSPSRSIAKESELVYAKTYGQGVRAGLLTNLEAAKISNERGGILTEQEQTEYINLLNEFFAKEQILNAAKSQQSEESNAGAGTDSLAQQEQELKVLREKVLSYQVRQDAVYANTAETKARDESILFNTLFLTYKDGKMFFDGKNYEDKLTKLDTLAPNDEFLQKVFRKASWYCSAIAFGVRDFSKLNYDGDE